VTGAPRIGGTELFRIGLGTMPMSVPGRPSEEDAIRTIHAAIDAGVNLLDTADAYSDGESDMGRGERLIAGALEGHPRRDKVIVATKGGHTRSDSGEDWGVDGTRDYLRRACERSLRALRTDSIDLYQFHRPDPDTPITEAARALAELRDEGMIRHAGLSNVTVEQLEEAEAIVPIAAIQNQLSLEFTSPIAKGEVAACAARGIPFLAWTPLGGIPERPDSAVAKAARAHGVSPQRVALAWLLSLSSAVVPIPGSRRPATIEDSIKAVELKLEPGELERIDAEAGVDRAPLSAG
jgi:aryl-alcohol dehydrogenase-like predicted oxidoreductase